VEPARWERLKTLFQEALEREASARAGFLEAACGEDAALRDLVLRLLRAHAKEGVGPLDSPPPLPLDLLGEEREPPPPTRIGPYLVQRELGRGGMGTVYLAERDEPGLRRPVAVKVVRRGMDSAFVVGRFHTERQILAGLEHPGIARLYDGGTTAEGLPYFVMEYVDGEDLLTYCDERRLPIAGRLQLFRRVCEAVQYAHQSLVVHRDLKPSNVLVTPAGEPKLLDFGIAKLLSPQPGEEGMDRTSSVIRLMTPDFASPEQVRGERATTASDVYSLGVILYELLSGHRPYRVKGTSPSEIERTVLESDVDPPSAAVARALRRDLRGDLDNVVLKALHRDPAHRYATAAELAEDLRRHLDGFPVRARPDRRSYRAAKFLRRHRVGVGVAAVTVAALVAGLTLALLGFTRARRAEAVARAEAETARHVSEFLVELFKINEPGESKGSAVTARELLDRGALRIDEQLAGQPAVRARLLNAMGRAYGELGLYEPQVRTLEQELRAHVALHGEESRDAARTLTLLTKAEMDRGRYAEALALGQRALALQERLLGPEHLEVANARNQLGMACWRLGDLKSAKLHLERSLAIREKVLGPDHRDLGGVLNNVAILRWQEGDTDGARPLCERALVIFERDHDPDHPNVVRTVNNLAILYLQARDLARARALNERALASRRRMLAPDHPEIAESLTNLGEVLRLAGELEPARVALLEALSIRERVLPPGHELTGTTLTNLGLTLVQLGDTAAARPYLQRAASIFEAALGTDHYNLGYPISGLAMLDHRAGDRAAAERGYRQAIALMGKVLGADHPDVMEVRHSYATLLRDLGREAEAVEAERPAAITPPVAGQP
jgi:serine/threonine-protein kinase